jgi:uncharacterized protein YbjT (DUF2867 family)
MILVTGATGNVGRPLVARLAAAGVKVRALTRRPAEAGFPDGVEAVSEARFDGVDALVLNIAGSSGNPGALLTAAVEAGVRRVVTVSALVVEDGGGDVADLHRGVELAVEAGVPEWTHLRPGAFAANSLHWRDQVLAGDVVRGPYAQACTSPIHEDDIAEVGVRALLTDELVGQAPPLTGPQSLTFAEQVRTIGEVLGRPLRYEEISHEAAKQAMMAGNSWFTEEAVESMLGYFAESVGTTAPVTNEVERILGHPARTYADWVTDHAAAFRA